MHDLLAPANAIACLYETVTFVASIFDQKKKMHIYVYTGSEGQILKIAERHLVM